MRVLIVEDERKILNGLARGVQVAGYEVLTASTGDEGYRLALAQLPDCIVLDLMLPGRDGLDVLAGLRSAGFCRSRVRMRAWRRNAANHCGWIHS